MKKVITAGFIMVAVLLAWIYLLPPDLAGSLRVEEVQRLASSDGRAEAVVWMIDGGATTSRAYNVFIVPKGEKPAEEYHMITFDGPSLANGEYGIAIGWLSPTELEAGSAKSKQVFEFRSSASIHGVTYHLKRKS
jgi:hypothetical protein